MSQLSDHPSPSLPRVSQALTSFLLGLASLAGLLAVTGVPAMFVGLRALRAINAAGPSGSRRAVRLAVAGMVLGGIGTAVTLLGVVAIIFVQLQGTSRRVECVNHLRQIGTSLNKYAGLNGTFPAASSTPAALPPDRRISWMGDLVPYLSDVGAASHAYQSLAKQIDRTRGWDSPTNAEVLATTIRVYLCPAATHLPFPRTVGLTSYVGITGVGADAASLPRDSALAGIFGHDRGVKFSEITGGISYTLMAAETAHDNGPWLAAGPPTARGLEAGTDRYCGPGRPFGGLHFRVTNMLYADGSVRPVADDTPGEVLRRQATLRRGDEGAAEKK